jgi:hypothetical protein
MRYYPRGNVVKLFTVVSNYYSLKLVKGFITLPPGIYCINKVSFNKIAFYQKTYVPLKI